MAETRTTNQRIKILEYLSSVKTHPTAEQVYESVRKELPAISLATVYRNLNLLAERGEILKLEINGEMRYDADTCFHQHCVCRKCGRILDVSNKELPKYAMKHFKSREFTPDCVTIIFIGACKSCG